MKEPSKKQRIKLINWFEQVIAGLEAGDADAEAKARHFIASTATDESRSRILLVMRACLKVLDEMQPQVDEDLRSEP